jgi:hypothetical protein
VDSVLSNSVLNYNQQAQIPPFKIQIGLINKATILDVNQEYTLSLKQIPNSTYYYIENLDQVLSGNFDTTKLGLYKINHTKNIDILTNGTFQERRNLIDSINSSRYKRQYNDYRYLPYLMSYMNTNDTITNYSYLAWDNVDQSGNMVSGGIDTVREKELYSRFLQKYVAENVPFALPNQSTDSIEWHQWFDSISSLSDCFAKVKYSTGEFKYITDAKWIGYFIQDPVKNTIYFRSGKKGYALKFKIDSLAKMEYPENRQLFSDYKSFYASNNHEIPRYNDYLKGIELYHLENEFFTKREELLIPIDLTFQKYSGSFQEYPNIIAPLGDNFLIITSQNPDGFNSINASVIDRNGNKVVEEKKIYQKISKSYAGKVDELNSISFLQNKDEVIISFSDESFGPEPNKVGEYSDVAAIVYKLDEGLNVKDSAIFPVSFPAFDYRITQTHIIQGQQSFLLLNKVTHNDGYQLFYKIISHDLSEKTEFIKLSDDLNGDLYAKPIVTSDGYIISWVGNDLTENLLRSVLINEKGIQAEPINVANGMFEEIYNIAFDSNHIDIYFLDKNEESLVRKRHIREAYKDSN